MFDVILHATDFSPEADDAFRVACALARDNFANLVVVHVIMPAVEDFDSELMKDVAEVDSPYVRECKEQFRRMEGMATGIPISFRLVSGYPVGAILNVVEEEGAELLVISSDRKNHFHLTLHGSIAEGLMRQSAIPVCCVRQPSLSQQRLKGDPPTPAAEQSPTPEKTPPPSKN